MSDSIDQNNTNSFPYSNSESEEDCEKEYDGWINHFCSLKGHEFFCEVDEEYIRDDFNLNGLEKVVPFYEHALDVILNNVDIINNDYDLSHKERKMMELATRTLYGLIHARFILTPCGMQYMKQKYENGIFGQCPRVICSQQNVLPFGQSDKIGVSIVKMYCCNCNDIYSYPKNSPYYNNKNLDGAYWGTTFAPLFCQTFSELTMVKDKSVFIPRIYGFKIYKNDLDNGKINDEW